MTKDYKICNFCIMDTTDPDITFDETGQCHHCKKYLSNKDSWRITPEKTAELNRIVEAIKADGKGKSHDCIIGVSGGVDSTYVAYLTKELGLRPLAVHLDNGWNSELAVANIEKTLNKLDIELYTYVINWEEFKDLQKSFLKASIPGMEIPTDHAIWSILKIVASEQSIKYILNGSNNSTEFIMAKKWSEGDGQLDWLLIQNVQKKFGKVKLKTFPHSSIYDEVKFKLIKKVRTINVLNFVKYSKNDAMKVLQNELEWVYYGGKHYESIYTRFTQGYIQPTKFGFDKRRAHLSNLICYGELSRDEAIGVMKENPYPSMELLKQDTEFFKNKLDFTDNSFKEMMEAKKYRFYDYDGYFNHPIYGFIKNKALALNRLLHKFNFYGKTVEKI